MKTARVLIVPRYEDLPPEFQYYFRQFAEILKRNHAALFDDIRPNIKGFADGDLTPSVKNGNGKLFYFQNTSSKTITDFDDAEDGQIIYIIGDANTTINDGTNFKLSANWTPNADDTLTLGFKGNVWNEFGRSAN